MDWEASSVGSLARELVNGGTPDTKAEAYWRGDIPWITGADFSKQKVIAARRHITQEAVRSSTTNVLPKGSILIVTRTGVGKLAIAPFDLAISQDITGLIPDTNRVHPEYLFWALNMLVPQLKATHQGTSINGVLRSDLEAFALPLPPKQEQKKIAEILSAIEASIEKAAAAAQATRKLKQGLIQEVFVRMPRQYGWKMSSIGDCTSINVEALGEATPPDSRFRYIDISSVDNRGTISEMREVVFKAAPSRARRVVRSGDILVSTVRPYLMAFTKIDDAPENLIASTGFAVLNPKLMVDGDFLYQFIRSDRFVNFLVERMTGSNYPAVNAGDVAMCPIPLPELGEQRAIGQRLLAVDRAILQSEAACERMEVLKEGLMQVLLTGKVRV